MSNLTFDKLKELNILLQNRNLDLPQLRRAVAKSGSNYKC